MNEFSIHVKTLKFGQPRAYADSEYEYEITAEGCYEDYVKHFCTTFLKPCKQTHEQWDIKNADSYFHGYYAFQKTGENKYRYFKLSPYTG